MELFARLENIEFHVRQLQKKCADLEAKNEQLTEKNQLLQDRLNAKQQDLEKLEETNKFSKLAQGASSTHQDNTGFKNQIDQIIKEIDDCLTLVKQ